MTFIPEAETNRDWRKYQEWLAEGNKPLPADPVYKPDPALAIDAKTDRAITTALHETAGRGEEAALIRSQIVDILNALGIEPNVEFAAYNEIAIAEIEKARIRKEAL